MNKLRVWFAAYGAAIALSWLSITPAIAQPVGSASGGYAANQSVLSGCVYRSSGPSLTTGQQVAGQCDASGNLKVNVMQGGGTGGTASSFGAAFPGSGTAIGAKNGSNMVNLTADGSNNLNVNCASGCAGGTFNNNADGVATSATNGQTGAWTYGFNGTTWDRLRVDGSKNLNVNCAVGCSNIGVAQGSTTAGQNGPLVQGAVTTASPSYSTGQTSPLSLDTAGNLRVNIVAGGATGGTSSNFAAAFPASGTAMGAKNGSNMVNLAADGSNNLDVNVQVNGIEGSAALTDSASCSSGTTMLACLRQLDTDLVQPIPAGSNLIGTVGPAAVSSGGASATLQGTLSNSAQAIKASAGSLYYLQCYNPNGAVEYVQVFNVAAASVSLGVTTPTMSIGVPATSSGGFSMTAVPIAFGTAISWAATTTYNGSTAPGSGLVCNAAYN